MACGLHPADCIADHICPVTDGRATTKPSNWRARCPGCGRTTLSISAGKSARIVWTCHAGCTQPDVRAALIKAGVAECCLPRRSPKRSVQRQVPDRNTEIVRQLDKLLDQPISGNSFKLRAAMLVRDLDAKAAAEQLGIP